MSDFKDNLSRRGFIAGAALATAGLGLSACAPRTEKEQPIASTGDDSQGISWDYEADVVIVGAGGAGLMAADAAHENGASAIVLESQSMVGGDTFTCGCFVTAPWPETTKKGSGANLTDEEYVVQWKKDFELTRPYSNLALAGGELPAETPLSDRQLELTSDMFQRTADLGVEWTFWEECEWFPGAEGTLFSGQFVASNRVIPSLEAAVGGYEDVEILTNAEAYDLVVQDGRAIGVLADVFGARTAVKARKGVILSTGSFTHNRSLLAENMPANVGFPSCGTPGITGLGHQMAVRAGANLRDMDLGLHWFCASFGSAEQTDTLATVQAVHGGAAGAVEGILVNAKGKRYVNECNGYSHTGYYTSQQPYQSGWYITDAAGAPYLPVDDEAYLKVQAETLDELAGKIPVDKEGLLAEIERYNGYVEAGEDPDFGKNMNCPKIETAPFFAFPMYPRFYVTYGGIETDPDSHVLNATGDPIPGLYAAGLCTGSYGAQEGFFYPGGLGQALVFGRQAGRLAVTEN